MGLFYTLGGLVVLFPYLVLPVAIAIPTAGMAAILLLLGVGYAKGRITGVSPIRSALEMMFVSFIAVLLGFIIGRLIPGFFGLEAVY